MSLPPFARRVPAGLELALTVVPGARRDAVVGALGDRLKVAVRAPVCALVAAHLGVDAGRVVLTAGQHQPRKTLVVKDLGEWRPGR